MTKNEFYQKWKTGSREATIFYCKEEMLNDLDRVIAHEVSDWRKFVGMFCQRLENHDDYLENEIKEIEQRR